MKKMLSIPLILCLLASGSHIAAAKKGAEVVIKKTDGTSLSGELVTVKTSPDSLLLQEAQSLSDVTLSLDDVETVIVQKKPKLVLGVLMGAVAGGVTGLLIGGFIGALNTEENVTWDYANVTGIGGMLGGALGGGYLGHRAGKDQVIPVSGLSTEQRAETIEKLKSLARIPEMQ